MIDLRVRHDGFINTPPVASVVSPQYAIVNQTIQINIPVSDVNAGDDVRCRWSTYTPGNRRRRSNDIRSSRDDDDDDYYLITSHLNRVKRTCSSGCTYGDHCSDTSCQGTDCTSNKCWISCCPYIVTTASSITTLSTATVATTTSAATTIATTTTEIQGTLKSTSSYPHRQALDECGGICYPKSTPNGTTLSNCTISFTGLKAGVWYAVAIQV